MRTLILPLILVLIILLLWAAFLIYTESSTDVLVNSMSEVYSYALCGDWEKAMDSNHVFMKEWDNSSKIYGLYLESSLMHDIELSANRCVGYLETQDVSLTAGEAASIIGHLKLLKENDRIAVKNIF